MRQTWRWFGPVDKVTLADARQAGAQGIVTALHHIATGAVWPVAEIEKRQAEVGRKADGTPTGLSWDVVESLPVSEAIKTQSGDWRGDIERYRQSLENLARCGIATICYNFMPVLDWTRTDLRAPTRTGGTAMIFDLVDFAAFDMHILRRPGAQGDYDEPIVRQAADRFTHMSGERKQALAENVTAGLPGSAERWTTADVRDKLADYAQIDADRLRRHHVDFLAEVAPTAERLGLRLCCHPDDPPFALLGLPRVWSTAGDVRDAFAAVSSPAIGLTLCAGSFGARPDNDIAAMVREFGPRIHFVHLRNVTRTTEGVPCSFVEDEHLEGGTDMVAVVAALMAEQARRRAEGRHDCEIPMRPDHGHEILDDAARGAQPGYPAIGRLKGLAELRGIMAAVEKGHAAQGAA
ncbi:MULTISPECIES: mannonate dehydratase [unclassified Roseitalea]|uniref:mannonate dehydratase n=1 Tax=unclassified Roseitalea TaxID=2639107 RepID=UPI00273F9DD1|nr:MULTISPECIES: mannonate dehydratase [unclassified Roseitalea]